MVSIEKVQRLQDQSVSIIDDYEQLADLEFALMVWRQNLKRDLATTPSKEASTSTNDCPATWLLAVCFSHGKTAPSNRFVACFLPGKGTLCAMGTIQGPRAVLWQG